MKRILIMLAGYAMVATPATGAENKTARFIMDIGGWSLMMDETLDDACFVGRGNADGTYFRLSYDDSRERLFFVASNSFWKSIDNDKPYRIEIKFDQGQPWIVNATGRRLSNGVPSLVFDVTEVDFIHDMRERRYFNMTWGGRSLGSFSLTGSSDALRALSDCQKKADEGRDPFAKKLPQPPPPVYIPPPVSKTRDPFAT